MYIYILYIHTVAAGDVVVAVPVRQPAARPPLLFVLD